MKVLQRGQMPDGTEVQIEEWSEDYLFYAYGSLVAAYPKNRYGEKVRANKTFESAEEAAKAIVWVAIALSLTIMAVFVQTI